MCAAPNAVGRLTAVSIGSAYVAILGTCLAPVAAARLVSGSGRKPSAYPGPGAARPGHLISIGTVI